MSKKLSIDIIKSRCYEIYKDEYLILSSSYTKMSDKILILHKNCNESWWITGNNFLNKKKKCPTCYGNKKLNIEIIKEKCYSLHKDEYSILSKNYINNLSKILIKHNICQNEFKMTPSDFLNSKHKCPECYGNKKLSVEQIKERIKISLGDGYELISKRIKNVSSKVKIKHKCGYIWSSLVTNLIYNKRGCPKCSGNKKYTISDIKLILPKDFKLISKDIKNIRSHLLVKHKCGYEFNAYGSAISSNRLICPKCCSSIGEKNIIEFLEKKNIYYICQYKFEDCRNKLPLPFDFYLPNHNICIEFDGIQHFEINEFFGGEKNYLDQLERDKIKNQYCMDNNIHLIRIPYHEINKIDTILLEI